MEASGTALSGPELVSERFTHQNTTSVTDEGPVEAKLKETAGAGVVPAGAVVVTCLGFKLLACAAARREKERVTRVFLRILDD